MWVRCRFEVSITCLPIFCLHAALNIGDQNEIYSPDLFLQATTPATQQQWRSEAIRAVVAAFAVVIEEEDRLEGEAEVIQVSAHNACCAEMKLTDDVLQDEEASNRKALARLPRCLVCLNTLLLSMFDED